MADDASAGDRQCRAAAGVDRGEFPRGFLRIDARNALRGLYHAQVTAVARELQQPEDVPPTEANLNRRLRQEKHMTETHEVDALAEALSIIDRALGEMLHRELVSTNEVADLLLDIRLLVASEAAVLVKN